MDEKHRAAMQQALEALKAGDRYIDMLEFELSCEQPETFFYKGTHRDREKVQAAIADIEAIIAALAEPEPVGIGAAYSQEAFVAAWKADLAQQSEPEQVRDQSDFGTWFCRLGKLADAYHETGRTHPARFKARGELMAHALDAVIGWRARSALEQQQSARQPLTDDQRGGLVMEHLGPAALTGGTMSVYDAFLAGLGAAERAHGIGGNK